MVGEKIYFSSGSPDGCKGIVSILHISALLGEAVGVAHYVHCQVGTLAHPLSTAG